MNTTACPASYVTICPITVVPERNEMYVWFVSADSSGDSVDQGFWQSENSGSSWTQISDSTSLNCGDSNGCGVEQAFYNSRTAGCSELCDWHADLCGQPNGCLRRSDQSLQVFDQCGEPNVLRCIFPEPHARLWL
jgi:hypothetical protein